MHEERVAAAGEVRLTIAVIAYPRISNLDEFQPLANIPGVRLRWARSKGAHRRETLPPFWTAFALTLNVRMQGKEAREAGFVRLSLAVVDPEVALRDGRGEECGIAAETVGVGRRPRIRVHSPVEQPPRDLQLVEVRGDVLAGLHRDAERKQCEVRLIQPQCQHVARQ